MGVTFMRMGVRGGGRRHLVAAVRIGGSGRGVAVHRMTAVHAVDGARRRPARHGGVGHAGDQWVIDMMILL